MTGIDSSRRESLARSGLTVLSWTRKIPVDIWSLSGSDSLPYGGLRSANSYHVYFHCEWGYSHPVHFGHGARPALLVPQESVKCEQYLLHVTMLQKMSSSNLWGHNLERCKLPFSIIVHKSSSVTVFNRDQRLDPKFQICQIPRSCQKTWVSLDEGVDSGQVIKKLAMIRDKDAEES
ncbi:predicted protein [Histoplasma capsulatum var. duboisii H88]|uniref:Predicted protein n=1 Tax=Ajellomyces capsulatus (strain H88) TaxID=544711 RepID=F0UGR9_AJEC8|nr:predicted protein [Histoplasma capsulatum var. duboisii H88]